MKLILILFPLLLLFSCNNVVRSYDSEISAIRDQTEVLKEQNKLIQEQNILLIKILNK